MRISDWSSDVCSSDLERFERCRGVGEFLGLQRLGDRARMRPFGVIVANVQPVAADLSLRQVLGQKPARDAARLCIVTRGKADQVRYLLRLPEILSGRFAD